jgi:hypothetical protein
MNGSMEQTVSSEVVQEITLSLWKTELITELIKTRHFYLF